MTGATDGAARVWVVASATAFVAAALVLPFVGPTSLDYRNVWNHVDPDWSILSRLRLSRTLLALIAGGALARAGSLFK